MTFKLGIMQGRLSPQLGERLQAYPSQTWHKEFELAQHLQLQFIEWVFDGTTPDNAILLQPRRVQRVIGETGVGVPVVCFDYLIDKFPEEGEFWAMSEFEFLLSQLAESSDQTGVKLIELPFVDKASASRSLVSQEAIEWLRKMAEILDRHGVQLGLETDLPPLTILETLKRINHPNVFLNYDTGNSAFMGFDTAEEIRLLAPLIRNIHIKDRDTSGKSVPLGAGEAQIDVTLREAKKLSLNCTYTLQVARSSDEVTTARESMSYLAHIRRAL